MHCVAVGAVPPLGAVECIVLLLELFLHSELFNALCCCWSCSSTRSCLMHCVAVGAVPPLGAI